MIEDVRQQMVELLPRLRRFAYSLTGSMDEADDLVQAACERALARLDQYQQGTRLDSWLVRIVQTTWIDRKRYARRRPTVSDPDMMASVGYDARIYEQAEARADLAVVRKHFGELPDEQRLVLALIVVEGRSYQEVAEILDLPIGTVMSRLFRARKKLMEALERPAQIAPSARKQTK
jgi:RNA polymerase sigma-70 factor (ECF subfamily)